MTCKLIYCLKLAEDMITDGFRETQKDTEQPAFLKKELMGYGVDG